MGPTTWTDYCDESCTPEDEVPPWGDIQAEKLGDAGRQLSSSYNTNAFPMAGPAVPKAKRKPNRESAKGSQSPETGGDTARNIQEQHESTDPDHCDLGRNDDMEEDDGYYENDDSMPPLEECDEEETVPEPM